MVASRIRRLSGFTILLAVLLGVSGAPALAEVYVPISGSGSTWSQNAIDQWRRNVNQYGLQVNYAGTGSSDGRNQFRNGTVDFAVSEIPYGLKDGGVTEQAPTRGYAYMPIVAGGTSLMYNLKIGGKRVTNLRLSSGTIAKIFTGQVTQWNDPAVAADNPGLGLPARRIVPVVRSDGSGTTAQFSLWLSKVAPDAWNSYCAKGGRPAPCGQTSTYPIVPRSGFTAQTGSLGVSGYVSQPNNEGTITYVETSYALNTGFPVVKMLNAAGYYVEPTPSNVAVALLGAKINDDPSSSAYLTQVLDGVYGNPDPRAYPLSSYSYIIVPTKVESNFSADKGKSLGVFTQYFLCEGQQQAPLLGYSPLPINLVQAGLEQVKRIPGVNVANINIAKCNNPTFSPDGTNVLAKNAPQPQACDKQGPTQCGTGTGGAKGTTTAVTTPSGTAKSGASAGAAAPGAAGASATTADQAAAAAAAAGGAAIAIDPTTGEAVAGDAAGVEAAAVSAGAVTVGTNPADQQTSSLIAIAVALLLALIVAPPVLATLLTRKAKP